MRHWLALGLVASTVFGDSPQRFVVAPQPGPLTVQAAVARYASGDFAIAVRDLDTRDLKVASFTRALDEWIATGDSASEPLRRRIAAAFALDEVWGATRGILSAIQVNRDPWNNSNADTPDRALLALPISQPHVARWAVQQLPAAGAPDAIERALWLAAVGIAEDGHAWHRLQSEILPLARRRLPDEPRLRLAEVLARTNIDLGSLRQGIGRDRTGNVLHVERLPPSVTGRIPSAIRLFEPLLEDTALSGEIELRIGYLELRRGKWLEALARFDSAGAKASEPTLRSAADYFGGWVHEQQGLDDDAITAYRRALSITPTMRDLATRLSALLYLHNERGEAYAALDLALNARPAPVDLLVAVERGDARFVPDWLMSIRRALQ